MMKPTHPTRSLRANNYLWGLHRFALNTVRGRFDKLSSLILELKKVDSSLLPAKEWDYMLSTIDLFTASLSAEALHNVLKNALRLTETASLDSGAFNRMIETIRRLYDDLGVETAKYEQQSKNELRLIILRQLDRLHQNECKVQGLESPQERNEIFRQNYREFQKAHGVKEPFEKITIEDLTKFWDFYLFLAVEFNFLSHEFIPLHWLNIDDAVRTSIENRFCFVCGAPNAEIHHLDALGTRTKRNSDEEKDVRIVALCRKHHNEAHARGINEFQKQYRLTESTITRRTL